MPFRICSTDALRHPILELLAPKRTNQEPFSGDPGWLKAFASQKDDWFRFVNYKLAI